MKKEGGELIWKRTNPAWLIPQICGHEFSDDFHAKHLIFQQSSKHFLLWFWSLHALTYMHILCCHAVSWICKQHQVFVRGFSNSNDHQFQTWKVSLRKFVIEETFYFSHQMLGRRRRNANVMLGRLQTCAQYTEMDAIKKRNTEIVMRNFYLTSLQTASLIAAASSWLKWIYSCCSSISASLCLCD